MKYGTRRFGSITARIETYILELLCLPLRALNLIYDLRFGGVLRGDIETRFAELQANNMVNTAYWSAALIFRDEVIASDDVLVDLGCGKGRVINWWLSCKLKNHIIGLELDPTIAATTAERLKSFKNVRIISGDALDNLPFDATLIYLYNPFGEGVVERLSDKLLQLMNPERVRLFYYNCLYAEVFERDRRFSVERPCLIRSRSLRWLKKMLEDRKQLYPLSIVRLNV